MSVIASVVIAKGSLFFLERTESDGFESQPGGVDLQSQGDSVAAYNPPTPPRHVSCAGTLPLSALVSAMRLRLFVLTFSPCKKWEAA